MAHHFADLFEHAVDAYGSDRLAVVEDNRRLTYADLEAEANRWAHVLSSRGVGPGDHVAVHLRNGVDCLALYFGVLKLRAVPISINYRYGGAELRYLYEYSDSCALVFHREFAPLVAGAVDGSTRCVTSSWSTTTPGSENCHPGPSTPVPRWRRRRRTGSPSSAVPTTCSSCSPAAPRANPKG